MRRTIHVLALVAFSIAASSADAQAPKPAPAVSLTVTRSATATAFKIGERTTVDFRGTVRMPRAGGTAAIVSEPGKTRVTVSLANLEPAATVGPYAAYVLWLVPEHGYALNLGEVVLDGRHGRASATVRSTTFALIVTAEPYFAVTVPSDAVVLETIAPGAEAGEGVQSAATFELFQQDHYDWLESAPAVQGGSAPAEIQQLRYALEVARAAGAEERAAAAWAKARDLASSAEALAASAKRGDRDRAARAAREAIRAAEDARAAAALPPPGAGD